MRCFWPPYPSPTSLCNSPNYLHQCLNLWCLRLSLRTIFWQYPMKICNPSCHHKSRFHYDCVITSAMTSQNTSLTVVYSTVYSGTDERKHQSSASLAFVRGIHRWPVNSPHKWPVSRKMFPFDDVIMHSLRCMCSFQETPTWLKSMQGKFVYTDPELWCHCNDRLGIIDLHVSYVQFHAIFSWTPVSVNGNWECKIKYIVNHSHRSSVWITTLCANIRNRLAPQVQ